MEIALAPLQGITDYHFRNIFCDFFDKPDIAYTPYIKLLKDNKIKQSQINDILPENNANLNIIPQILTNNAEEFIYLAKYLFDYGHKKINWNLGCPHSMVAKRSLGSGLLQFPEQIKAILTEVLDKIPNKLSIKTRLGYSDEDEFFKVLEVLNTFPISEIIIHPRTGKQMYKGNVDINKFEECLKQTKHKVSYNGDINNLETFQKLSERFKTVNSWMIGRGIISNPFLVGQIKHNKIDYPENKLSQFKEFHDALFEKYQELLSGSAHILNKMLNLWEYFALSFSNSKKVYKRIKKAKTIEKYKSAVRENFGEELWIS